MKITTSLFSQSFYYIGSGFDWEPMRRFSHYCQVFLYVNLYYTLEEVKGKLSSLNASSGLELLSMHVEQGFDETRYFELHPDYRAHIQQSTRAMTHSEKKDYSRIFGPALKEPQWIIHAKLKRLSTGREIDLYYFTAEGLATYTALSQNGRFAPKVIATVQTGPLDHPNGLFSRFIGQYNQKPAIWIRGYEPRNYYWPEGWKIKEVFSRDALYSEVVSDFGHPWKVAASYASMENESRRFCKAYTMPDRVAELTAIPFMDYGRNQLHYAGLEQIPDCRSMGRQLVILPQRLRDRLPDFIRGHEVKYWWYRFWRGDNSLADALSWIEEIDQQGEYASIWFTPHGWEDEGALLDAFLRKEHRAEMHVLAHRPFDLVDLRIAG
jgi:hypothetical protein